MLVPAGLYAWGSRSSTFAVDDVVISGVRRTSQTRALQLLEKRFLGRNLFRVRTDDVEQALSPLLFVSGVRIDRDFPSTLRVRVREHAPAAYVLAGDGWYLVSREGVVLGAVRDEDRSSKVALQKGPRDVVRRLPAVRAAADRLKRGTRVDDGDVEAALLVLRALSAETAAQVASVRTTAGGLRLRLRSAVTVDLGATTRLAAKATALAAVTSYYAEQQVAATYIDVSVPDRPVARPML